MIEEFRTDPATHELAPPVQAGTPDAVERACTHSGSRRVEWTYGDRTGRHSSNML
jgi:hypothetical protein